MRSVEMGVGNWKRENGNYSADDLERERAALRRVGFEK
jgi:hypothetical protein